MRWFLSMAAVALLASCSSGVPAATSTSGSSLPPTSSPTSISTTAPVVTALDGTRLVVSTIGTRDGWPAALIQGTLRRGERCVSIDTLDRSHVAVWASGASLESDGIRYGDKLYRFDEPVTGGGGYFTGAPAAPAFPAEALASCQPYTDLVLFAPQ